MILPESNKDCLHYLKINHRMVLFLLRLEIINDYLTVIQIINKNKNKYTNFYSMHQTEHYNDKMLEVLYELNGVN